MGHGALLLLLFLFIGAATVAHPMKWDQPLDGYATGKSSFEPAAYAVDWHDPPDSEATSDVAKKLEHGDVESSFEPAAYVVDWHDPPVSEAASDVAKKLEHDDVESSFEPAAYAVDWHDPPVSEAASDVAKKLEHGDVESSFEPAAYAVDWHDPPVSEAASDVAKKLEHGDVESSFEPAAYAVDWHDPPVSEAASYVAQKPEHGDVESSFEPAAYAVDWHDPPVSEAASDVAKKPEHGDVESSFEPATYAVDWHDPPDSEAASDVTKKPEHGDVESSLKSEAYPVKGDEKELSQPQAASHELHVEPGMLFLRKSLFPGAILPEGTKFAGGGNAASPARRSFVSKAAADAIPFGYEHLDTILRIFRIPRGSEKADQVAETLRTCEAASPESHTCATSREAAATFAAGALGTTKPRAVVTVVHGEEAAGARYTVAPNGVARIGGDAVVPCHPMPYPYMVHYCHRPAGVEALRVELLAAAEGTPAATAIAMCHADTASWDARYFRMLNATRGEEICHFLPHNYVLWLPAADR